MRTGPTNPQLKELIVELKKHSRENNQALWKKIALDLEMPSRNRRIVNLFKIDKYAKDNETIIVPGKVLGTGELSRKVTIAAANFSQSAVDKINKVGKAMTIQELMQSKIKPSDIKIIG